MLFNVHVPNVTELTVRQREQLECLGELRLGISWYGARPAAVLAGVDAMDALEAGRQVAAILRVRQETLTVVESME